MHKNRNLIISGFIIGSFLFIHFFIISHLTQPTAKAPKASKPKMPDFAAIEDTSARKRLFFEYLEPMIEAENQRLQKLRNSLHDKSKAELKKLAKLYNVAPDSDNLIQQLKIHIDVLPSSLVLAQAAIESAWGTSRFAQEGNNLFGQWCFKKGCGMVPQLRGPNQNHEVRKFKSPQASIKSYMHNLNSHPAYAQLRAQRADQRARQQALNGCYLAEGLEHYSEKGLAYVETIKTLIRANDLETNPQELCAPRAIAEPEDEPIEPTEDAA